LQQYAIWPSAFKACYGIITERSLTDGQKMPRTAAFHVSTERWSNGQTEGQINRLKTLKRAMFGRANTELLRARLLPLGEIADHRVCG